MKLPNLFSLFSADFRLPSVATVSDFIKIRPAPLGGLTFTRYEILFGYCLVTAFQISWSFPFPSLTTSLPVSIPSLMSKWEAKR